MSILLIHQFLLEPQYTVSAFEGIMCEWWLLKQRMFALRKMQGNYIRYLSGKLINMKRANTLCIQYNDHVLSTKMCDNHTTNKNHLNIFLVLVSCLFCYATQVLSISLYHDLSLLFNKTECIYNTVFFHVWQNFKRLKLFNSFFMIFLISLTKILHSTCE